VVLKNSRCWSQGDVGRQTVSEAASSHRKRTIAYDSNDEDKNYTSEVTSHIIIVTVTEYT